MASGEEFDPEKSAEEAGEQVHGFEIFSGINVKRNRSCPAWVVIFPWRSRPY